MQFKHNTRINTKQARPSDSMSLISYAAATLCLFGGLGCAESGPVSPSSHYPRLNDSLSRPPQTTALKQRDTREKRLPSFSLPYTSTVCHQNMQEEDRKLHLPNRPTLQYISVNLDSILWAIMYLNLFALFTQF